MSVEAHTISWTTLIWSFSAIPMETLILFIVRRSTSGVFMSEVLFHCSLKGNQLTDTGAIVLATALQHNKSLKELK